MALTWEEQNRADFDGFVDEHQADTGEQLAARRAQVIDAMALLEGYAHRTRSQDEQLGQLIAEDAALSMLTSRADTAAATARRSAEIDRITAIARDEGNLERPGGAVPAGLGGRQGASGPALVRQPGTRVESAQQTVSRANPWRDPDHGPLTHETAAGFSARANTCIETVSERLGHDGAELLSTLLSERRDTPGVTVRRSADEVRQGAEMIVALSSPYYESAMRHVFRNPDLFRTGLGAMVWSDDEREAVHAVMNNELVRAAFAETSGAAGAFALPPQLSPAILFTKTLASPPRTAISPGTRSGRVIPGMGSPRPARRPISFPKERPSPIRPRSSAPWSSPRARS